MTTLTPRAPHSQEELDRLYPKGLELQFVQVLLRHGERSPVSARFQNAGLPPYWPYCNAAQRLRSIVMTPADESSWKPLLWRRRLERFGEDDGPVVAAGPEGEVDGICQLGELTDKGRQTTYDLGKRLRHLYVDQLKFMPTLIADADMIYLRATPMPRALESVQQTFWGMYPLTARTASFPAPTIVTRTPADETLFPNDGNCRRFAQLSRAFAQRTANRWNDSDELDYVTKLISKWMPESSPNVAVDSHPRLSGIMDTINSTLGHGPATRLPSEFYDDKLRAIIDKIASEEWFSGYNENVEYRKLGIGALVGDVVERMAALIEGTGLSINEIGGENGQLGQGRGGEKAIRFALSGCHDTTLAGMLTALGTFSEEQWPPYTSHVAVELFRKVEVQSNPPADSDVSQTPASGTAKQAEATRPGFFAGMLGLRGSREHSTPADLARLTSGATSEDIARRPFTTLSQSEKDKLNGYYVRIRYNDKVMQIPECKKPGRHLDGDESLCTFEAFKRVADAFTPRNWKQECQTNLERKMDVVAVAGREQWAGYADEE